jgi:succinate dehydrogenase / fumarate reductase cytochrome b subunit
MMLFNNTVGRKLLMSCTGLLMIFFVIVHLLGNVSVFAGPSGINAWAAKLHRLMPILWLFRTAMFAICALHIYLGTLLTLENNASKPGPYAVRKTLRSTFSGRYMIWTGVLIAVYLAFHILHFTAHLINPELSSAAHIDEMGRPDVFMMMMLNFRNAVVLLVYISAMAALALHLTHGIQSFFQTLGLNNDKTLPVFIKAGTIAALMISLGYISIPVSIFSGILRW